MPLSRARLKDARGETHLFRVRALTGFALIVLAMLVLATRFFWLQVVQHNEYAARSTQNRVHLRRLPPPRGLIYDRNGVLLADNVPAFRLDVTPERVKNMDAMLKRLSMIIPLSDDDLKAFRRSLKQHRAFQSVPLKLRLNEDEIDRFAVNRWRFPGVEVVPYLSRHYPQGAMFAHVVGHVGRINPSELAHLNPDLYDGTTHIGKTGIERYYESRLHGVPGYEVVEVNADQRVQRVLQTHPPKPGESLYLTLDVRIQKAAYDALDGRAGAAVAIDPRNGQVLAMVSTPSFDPNLFVGGISSSDYAQLLHDPEKPLLDRAIRGGYPPGSTVKPFIGLGGLELGLRKPSDTVLSTGVFHIPGQARGYRDDQRYGAGRVDLVQAIEQSVNTYFYKLALDMGIDRFSAWMSKFGFGKPTGIDLPDESSGVLPSRQWKRIHRNQVWFPGETVIAGIGQGYWVVTPVQLASALSTLADGGVPHRPYLLDAVRRGIDGKRTPSPMPAPGKPIKHDTKDWDAVLQGMIGVVYGDKGTARGLGAGFPYVIAGKTGTAERYSRTTKAYEETTNTKVLARRHRALFEAFTPAEHPRIAVVVVLEHGAWGGSVAAPVARKILDAWLAEQKSRGTAPAPSTSTSAAEGTP
ncbi:penicillin-binding protein 2 [Oleiagrimonas sp.]|jgi:penicillin-binding protein 2|uniref:penicillin-binding protein 2 n=1 Tax=Oleiagrimonas sp. TaxID=2010330 RepID=UPI0026198A91|nr:penicillin-binding protein 2 [Oleiagrimonas sp.]MDA3915270.1 penicillin-binding protein 2 [Oleiagrimonas sp.]